MPNGTIEIDPSFIAELNYRLALLEEQINNSHRFGQTLFRESQGDITVKMEEILANLLQSSVKMGLIVSQTRKFLSLTIEGFSTVDSKKAKEFVSN